MLPTPNGQKIRIAPNPTKRRWLLAIGPDVTQAALREREKRAREDKRVQLLQQEHDELMDRAAALEAEAKALRDDAKFVKSAITDQVRQVVGPAKPVTETYDFQCDDEAAAWS